MQDSKTVQNVNDFILISSILLLITLTLLLGSYIYYQLVSRYDTAKYCFNARCFTVKSTRHIPPAFNLPKHRQRPSFAINNLELHQRYLLQIKSEFSALCEQDTNCIQRIDSNTLEQLIAMKIQNNWSSPFIGKTHDSRSGYSPQQIKSPWVEQAVMLVQEQLSHPAAAHFKGVVFSWNNQGEPIICGSVADNLNATSYLHYLRSVANLKYQRFIYLSPKNTVLWQDNKRKGDKISHKNSYSNFATLWQNKCYLE